MGNFIPKGSYKETCKNIKVTLTCQAKNGIGEWVNASYDLTNSDNPDLENINGVLKKAGSTPAIFFIPGGSYKLSCRNIHVSLTCSAKKISGSYVDAEYDLTNATTPDLSNIDGVLKNKSVRATARGIYTFNITSLSTTSNAYELILITTLQGLVAKKSDVQIYLYTTEDPDYIPTTEDKKKGLNTGLEFWLNKLTIAPGGPKLPIVEKNTTGDVWAAVNYFKDKIGINGYVVYDTQTTRISQDLITTLAGLSNAIPVTGDNIKKTESAGITEKSGDISNINLEKFYEDYGSYVSKDMAFELGNLPNYDVSNGPRDYAAMNNAVVYYPDDSNLRDTVLSKLNEASSILGWNPTGGSEKDFVNNISDYGDYVIACDWGQNISILNSTGTLPESSPGPMSKTSQNTSRTTYDSSRKYVTFLVSDGDNLQMWLNTANDKRWWGNDYRTEKQVPIGWTIAPCMYSLTPDVWNFYMASAVKNGKGNDEFVVSPSGIGYIFGSITKKMDAFKKQLKTLNDFMAADKGNISTVSIFGDNNWNNKDYLSQFMNQENCSGGFYFEFTPWPPSSGADPLVRTFNNKPIIHANVFLDDSSIDKAANEINQNSFSVVYVIKNLVGRGNVGNFIMTDIKDTVSRLNTDVIVVSPSEMIELVKKSGIGQ